MPVYRGYALVVAQTTTVKVPVALRERIAVRARQRGISQAAVVAAALDSLERSDFWDSVGDGYAQLQREPGQWNDYVAERDAWLADQMTDDG